jgi:hypothetical protein
LLAYFSPLCSCGKSDRHYDFKGRVVSKVSETHTLVVDHENIPGFMAAMTMPYPVAANVDLSGSKLETGSRPEWLSTKMATTS